MGGVDRLHHLCPAHRKRVHGVCPEILGSQPSGPLRRETPQRAPDDPRHSGKTDEAPKPAHIFDRPSSQAPENRIDLRQAEQIGAFDLVEKHGLPAVPLALHHQGGDGARMQIEARPWKRQIGASYSGHFWPARASAFTQMAPHPIGRCRNFRAAATDGTLMVQLPATTWDFLPK